MKFRKEKPGSAKVKSTVERAPASRLSSHKYRIEEVGDNSRAATSRRNDAVADIIGRTSRSATGLRTKFYSLTAEKPKPKQRVAARTRKSGNASTAESTTTSQDERLVESLSCQSENQDTKPTSLCAKKSGSQNSSVQGRQTGKATLSKLQQKSVLVSKSFAPNVHPSQVTASVTSKSIGIRNPKPAGRQLHSSNDKVLSTNNSKQSSRNISPKSALSSTNNLKKSPKCASKISSEKTEITKNDSTGALLDNFEGVGSVFLTPPLEVTGNQNNDASCQLEISDSPKNETARSKKHDFKAVQNSAVADVHTSNERIDVDKEQSQLTMKGRKRASMERKRQSASPKTRNLKVKIPFSKQTSVQTSQKLSKSPIDQIGLKTRVNARGHNSLSPQNYEMLEHPGNVRVVGFPLKTKSAFKTSQNAAIIPQNVKGPGSGPKRKVSASPHKDMRGQSRELPKEHQSLHAKHYKNTKLKVRLSNSPTFSNPHPSEPVKGHRQVPRSHQGRSPKFSRSRSHEEDDPMESLVCDRSLYSNVPYTAPNTLPHKYTTNSITDNYYGSPHAPKFSNKIVPSKYAPSSITDTFTSHYPSKHDFDQSEDSEEEDGPVMTLSADEKEVESSSSCDEERRPSSDKSYFTDMREKDDLRRKGFPPHESNPERGYNPYAEYEHYPPDPYKTPRYGRWPDSRHPYYQEEMGYMPPPPPPQIDPRYSDPYGSMFRRQPGFGMDRRRTMDYRSKYGQQSYPAYGSAPFRSGPARPRPPETLTRAQYEMQRMDELPGKYRHQYGGPFYTEPRHAYYQKIDPRGRQSYPFRPEEEHYSSYRAHVESPIVPRNKYHRSKSMTDPPIRSFSSDAVEVIDYSRIEEAHTPPVKPRHAAQTRHNIADDCLVVDLNEFRKPKPKQKKRLTKRLPTCEEISIVTESSDNESLMQYPTKVVPFRQFLVTPAKVSKQMHRIAAKQKTKRLKPSVLRSRKILKRAIQSSIMSDYESSICGDPQADSLENLNFSTEAVHGTSQEVSFEDPKPAPPRRSMSAPKPSKSCSKGRKPCKDSLMTMNSRGKEILSVKPGSKLYSFKDAVDDQRLLHEVPAIFIDDSVERGTVEETCQDSEEQADAESDHELDAEDEPMDCDVNGEKHLMDSKKSHQIPEDDFEEPDKDEDGGHLVDAVQDEDSEHPNYAEMEEESASESEPEANVNHGFKVDEVVVLSDTSEETVSVINPSVEPETENQEDLENVAEALETTKTFVFQEDRDDGSDIEEQVYSNQFFSKTQKSPKISKSMEDVHEEIKDKISNRSKKSVTPSKMQTPEIELAAEMYSKLPCDTPQEILNIINTTPPKLGDQTRNLPKKKYRSAKAKEMASKKSSSKVQDQEILTNDAKKSPKLISKQKSATPKKSPISNKSPKLKPLTSLKSPKSKLQRQKSPGSPQMILQDRVDREELSDLTSPSRKSAASTDHIESHQPLVPVRRKKFKSAKAKALEEAYDSDNIDTVSTPATAKKYKSAKSTSAERMSTEELHVNAEDTELSGLEPPVAGHGSVPKVKKYKAAKRSSVPPEEVHSACTEDENDTEDDPNHVVYKKHEFSIPNLKDVLNKKIAVPSNYLNSILLPVVVMRKALVHPKTQGGEAIHRRAIRTQIKKENNHLESIKVFTDPYNFSDDESPPSLKSSVTSSSDSEIRYSLVEPEDPSRENSENTELEAEPDVQNSSSSSHQNFDDASDILGYLSSSDEDSNTLYSLAEDAVEFTDDLEDSNKRVAEIQSELDADDLDNPQNATEVLSEDGESHEKESETEMEVGQNSDIEENNQDTKNAEKSLIPDSDTESLSIGDHLQSVADQESSGPQNLASEESTESMTRKKGRRRHESEDNAEHDVTPTNLQKSPTSSQKQPAKRGRKSTSKIIHDVPSTDTSEPAPVKRKRGRPPKDKSLTSSVPKTSSRHKKRKSWSNFSSVTQSDQSKNRSDNSSVSKTQSQTDISITSPVSEILPSSSVPSIKMSIPKASMSEKRTRSLDKFVESSEETAPDTCSEEDQPRTPELFPDAENLAENNPKMTGHDLDEEIEMDEKKLRATEKSLSDSKLKASNDHHHGQEATSSVPVGDNAQDLAVKSIILFDKSCGESEDLADQTSLNVSAAAEPRHTQRAASMRPVDYATQDLAVKSITVTDKSCEESENLSDQTLDESTAEEPQRKKQIRKRNLIQERCQQKDDSMAENRTNLETKGEPGIKEDASERNQNEESVESENVVEVHSGIVEDTSKAVPENSVNNDADASKSPLPMKPVEPKLKSPTVPKSKTVISRLTGKRPSTSTPKFFLNQHQPLQQGLSDISEESSTMEEGSKPAARSKVKSSKKNRRNVLRKSKSNVSKEKASTSKSLSVTETPMADTISDISSISSNSEYVQKDDSLSITGVQYLNSSLEEDEEEKETLKEDEAIMCLMDPPTFIKSSTDTVKKAADSTSDLGKVRIKKKHIQAKVLKQQANDHWKKIAQGPSSLYYDKGSEIVQSTPIDLADIQLEKLPLNGFQLISSFENFDQNIDEITSQQKIKKGAHEIEDILENMSSLLDTLRGQKEEYDSDEDDDASRNFGFQNKMSAAQDISNSFSDMPDEDHQSADACVGFELEQARATENQLPSPASKDKMSPVKSPRLSTSLFTPPKTAFPLDRVIKSPAVKKLNLSDPKDKTKSRPSLNIDENMAESQLETNDLKTAPKHLSTSNPAHGFGENMAEKDENDGPETNPQIQSTSKLTPNIDENVAGRKLAHKTDPQTLCCSETDTKAQERLPGSNVDSEAQTDHECADDTLNQENSQDLHDESDSRTLSISDNLLSYTQMNETTQKSMDKSLNLQVVIEPLEKKLVIDGVVWKRKGSTWKSSSSNLVKSSFEISQFLKDMRKDAKPKEPKVTSTGQEQASTSATELTDFERAISRPKNLVKKVRKFRIKRIPTDEADTSKKDKSKTTVTSPEKVRLSPQKAMSPKKDVTSPKKVMISPKKVTIMKPKSPIQEIQAPISKLAQNILKKKQIEAEKLEKVKESVVLELPGSFESILSKKPSPVIDHQAPTKLKPKFNSSFKIPSKKEVADEEENEFVSPLEKGYKDDSSTSSLEFLTNKSTSLLQSGRSVMEKSGFVFGDTKIIRSPFTKKGATSADTSLPIFASKVKNSPNPEGEFQKEQLLKNLESAFSSKPSKSFTFGTSSFSFDQKSTEPFSTSLGFLNPNQKSVSMFSMAEGPKCPASPAGSMTSTSSRSTISSVNKITAKQRLDDVLDTGNLSPVKKLKLTATRTSVAKSPVSPVKSTNFIESSSKSVEKPHSIGKAEKADVSLSTSSHSADLNISKTKPCGSKDLNISKTQSSRAKDLNISKTSGSKDLNISKTQSSRAKDLNISTQSNRAKDHIPESSAQVIKEQDSPESNTGSVPKLKIESGSILKVENDESAFMTIDQTGFESKLASSLEEGELRDSVMESDSDERGNNSDEELEIHSESESIDDSSHISKVSDIKSSNSRTDKPEKSIESSTSKKVKDDEDDDSKKSVSDDSNDDSSDDEEIKGTKSRIETSQDDSDSESSEEEKAVVEPLLGLLDEYEDEFMDEYVEEVKSNEKETKKKKPAILDDDLDESSSDIKGPEEQDKKSDMDLESEVGDSPETTLREQPGPPFIQNSLKLIPKTYCFNYVRDPTSCRNPDCHFKHQQPSKEECHQHVSYQIHQAIKENRPKDAVDYFMEFERAGYGVIHHFVKPVLFCCYQLGFTYTHIAHNLLGVLFNLELLDASICDGFIQCCSVKRGEYSKLLWEIFEVIQSLNIQPTPESVITLLMTFYECEFVKELFEVMIYSNELDFTIPLVIRNFALTEALNNPEYFTSAMKWIQQTNEEFLIEFDHKMLEQLINMFLRSKQTELVETLNIIRVRKLRLKDEAPQIEEPEVDREEARIQAACNFESPQLQKEEKTSHAHRIQGCKLSYNWEYLAQIFLDLCGMSWPRNTDYIDLYIDTLTSPKTETKILEAFKKFLEKLQEIVKIERNHNVLLEFDTRSLSQICCGIIQFCCNKHYYITGFNILEQLIQYDIKICSRHPDTIHTPLLNILDICNQVSIPLAAVRVLEDLKWLKYNQEIVQDVDKYGHILDDLIVKSVSKKLNYQAFQLLSFLIHILETGGRDIEELSSLKPHFNEIIMSSLSKGVVEPAIKTFILDREKHRKKHVLVPITLRSLFAACYQLDDIENAKRVFNYAINREDVYIMQENRRQILIGSNLTFGETDYQIRHYLLQMYRLFCNKTMSGEVLSFDELKISIILNHNDCANVPFLSTAAPQCDYAAMELIKLSLVNLNPPINFNQRYKGPINGGIFFLNPLDVQKYMHALDSQEIKQGLRFTQSSSQRSGRSSGPLLPRLGYPDRNRSHFPGHPHNIRQPRFQSRPKQSRWN